LTGINYSLVPTLLRGNASPTRCVIKSRQSNKSSLDQLKPADVTEFNSATSLVNFDLLTLRVNLVRDYRIPNQPLR
jgi:hypothetical protein